MSVKIRLFRRGRKKLALFDLVVADARAPRDGKFIEKIGVYNPNTNPATIELNEAKAFDWVMKGAQPTNTVKAMLSYKGILFHKHLQIGVNKGAITQEDADKKLAAWKEAKTSKIDGKKDKLSTAKQKAAKEKLEAEVRVNAAREESIKNKNKVVEEVAAEPAAEVEAPVAAADEVQAPVAVVVEAPVVTAEVEAPAAAPEVVEAPAAEAPAPAVAETPEAAAPEAPVAE
jgi:small subunit ribosomal protein S16